MANYIKVYSKKDLKSYNGCMYEFDKETQQMVKANGILRTVYPMSGVVQDETPYQDGVLNGVQKVFDGSGSLWYENTWKDGVLVKFAYIN